MIDRDDYIDLTKTTITGSSNWWTNHFGNVSEEDDIAVDE